MLQNYFKIAIRNLLRNRIYTFINILGLSLGMACAIVLYLYIQHELSYDSYHQKYKEIYRATTDMKMGDNHIKFGITSGLLAGTLQKEYPEVRKVCRVHGTYRYLVENGKSKLYENDIYYVDSTFFDFFDYEFLQGNPQKALLQPNSVVITKRFAEKVFGSAVNAIGKTLKFNEKENDVITGVIDNPPLNSNIDFNVLISLSTIAKEAEEHNLNSWGSYGDLFTFVLLPKDYKIKNLEAKMPKLIEKHIADEGWRKIGMKMKILFQPLEDMYLKSSHLRGEEGNGDMAYIYTFSLVAVFILLIASINYMNLATARSASRAKEVGIRKVVGSYKSQLIFQFLTESILLTFISLLISLCLVEFSLPFINHLTDKDLSIYSLINTENIIFLLLFGLGLGILSGFYPAFVLSSFKPMEVLKGKFSTQAKGVSLRKGLVIFQFTISIVMMIGTWIVYEQLLYMKNQKLGFNQNQLIHLNIENKNVLNKVPLLKDRIRQNPNVVAVTASNNRIGENDMSTSTFEFKVKGESKIIQGQRIGIDYDYLKTLEIPLKAGRNFSPKMPSDTSKSILVNETMLKRLQITAQEAIGIKMEGRNNSYQIVGVIQDYHLRSLHLEINPMVIFLSQQDGDNIFIRISPQNITQTLQLVKKNYENFDNKYPFEAVFLDQTFARQYQDDEKRSTIFLIFSGLTILIACLGLFGLASFTAQQRTKEIGIRKVLGASMGNILGLLSKDFIALVAIAFMIASPIAYYFMNQWLQNFAYRTEFNFIIFLFSGLLTLFIALATVSFQAWRTAQVNPVEVLRNE